MLLVWLLLVGLYLKQHAYATDGNKRISGFEGVKEPWNLPVLPKVLPSEQELRDLMYANSNGKKIPRHLWMAFKTVPEEKDMKSYLKRMFLKNTDRNCKKYRPQQRSSLNLIKRIHLDV